MGPLKSPYCVATIVLLAHDFSDRSGSRADYSIPPNVGNPMWVPSILLQGSWGFAGFWGGLGCGELSWSELGKSELEAPYFRTSNKGNRWVLSSRSLPSAWGGVPLASGVGVGAWGQCLKKSWIPPFKMLCSEAGASCIVFMFWFDLLE